MSACENSLLFLDAKIALTHFFRQQKMGHWFETKHEKSQVTRESNLNDTPTKTKPGGIFLLPGTRNSDSDIQF